MNEPATPPPQGGGGGCCGMGCLTLFALITFFAFAFAGGGLWAVHHFGRKYTSPEPVALPEVVTPDTPADVDPSTALEAAPPPAPPPLVSVPEMEKRWKQFEKAADRNQRARIELTAGEINALLQNSKNTRGKVFVSIENNIGHVRVSIPLKDVPLMKGRYLNGEATVEASPDGDPNKARISNILLSNQRMSDSVMDRRMFGLSSMRGSIADWLTKQNIETFRIENNRVISETRGDR